MNNLDKQYQDLLRTILEYGIDKEDRTGTGTKSIFGYTIRHNMQDGFPLLTSKKMYWKGITTELMWFLLGDTNIQFLHDNDCHIWDGDYEKSGRTDGELGPIYGKQWRDWEYYCGGGDCNVDQIQNLINELKTNPDSRRLMVSAWNVGELDQMVLPPCHYGFQVYTRKLTFEERTRLYNKTLGEEFEDKKWLPNKDFIESRLKTENIPIRAISLMWNQRSVDTFLGLPFNIASYGLLLEMIAKEVNMVPDQLIGNLGDVHLYNNHIEQTKELLGRSLRPLPKLKILNGSNFKAAMEYRKDDIYLDDFVLSNYKPHPSIKAPLSN